MDDLLGWESSSAEQTEGPKGRRQEEETEVKQTTERSELHIQMNKTRTHDAV